LYYFIAQQKQFENEQALKYLPSRLQKLDAIEDKNELILELSKGLLAGNVFDWGAKEVAEIMEKGEFKFEDAQDKLQGRNQKKQGGKSE
jgi:type II pantothenate kinase